MKKITLSLAILLTVLSGCSQAEKEFTGSPTIEGYVVRVTDNDLLVVNGITKDQAVSMSWKEIDRYIDKEIEAISFYTKGFFNSVSEYQKGQKVKVWGASGAGESYPPKIKLGKIEVVEKD